jgi:hypothetical protein
VALQPTVIIEVPLGGAVERQLSDSSPAALASGEVALEPGPTDAAGNLEAAAAGQTIMSVPSPETLRRDAAEVRRVIKGAGTGVEPLVIAVEAARELREDELAAVVEAARHASRPVILRIVREG